MKNKTHENINEKKLMSMSDKKLDGARHDDISTNKLKAVSVLLFVFIVCMCAFGL